MEKTNNITGDEDYKLWKFFKDEHDLILLDGQITDIIIEVEKYRKIKLKADEANGLFNK